MSTGKGIFVACRLSEGSLKQLKNLCAIMGIHPSNIDKDTHITLLYSKEPLNSDYKPLDGLYIRVTPTNIAYIGDYVAIMLESMWLRKQQSRLLANGGINTFSGYIPHVSLMKDPPKDLPLLLGKRFLKDLDLRVVGTRIEPLKD